MGELARAGAIVYVTGRSAAGASTDALLAGSVDETAAQLTKMAGLGVAVHADHSQAIQNQAIATMMAANHNKIDVLVNNAFFIPKPDQLFFGTPLWKQPLRFLNEQHAVGGLNHAAETLLWAPMLRRGKGVVVNVSSWGSQTNIEAFPISYYVNKGAFDATQSALAAQLRQYSIYIMTLWPGSVRSERSVLAAKRTGAILADAESTRFTGKAIVLVAKMQPTQLYHFSKRIISSSDIVGWDGTNDVDGYKHEFGLHTFVASQS